MRLEEKENQSKMDSESYCTRVCERHLQSAFDEVNLVLTGPVGVRPDLAKCFPDVPATAVRIALGVT